MQQLLDKAQEISGVKFDISSYADIVKAIHVVQQEMGISGISAEEAAELVASGAMTQEEAYAAMGTTAKEAATTIQGSAGSIKAAWDNLVTGIARPDADLGRLIGDVVASAETALNNFLPAFEQAINGIATFVEKAAPIIAKRLPKFIKNILPSILNAGASLLNSIVKVLPQTIQQLITQIVNLFTKYAPQLVKAGVEAIVQLAKGLSKSLPKIIPAIVDAVVLIADTLIDNIPLLIDAALKLMEGLAEGLVKALPKVIKKIPEIIRSIVNAFIKAWPQITQSFTKLIESDISNIILIFGGLATAFKGFRFDGIVKGIFSAFKNLTGTITGPVTLAFKSLTGTIGGPVLGAVGGLIAAFVTLRENFNKQVKAEFGLTEQQKKTIEKAGDLITAYHDMDAARKDSMEAIENEYGHLEDLKTEYNNLIGTDGKVKEGYEKRASFILNELAKAMGIEREEIEKTIQKNGKLGQSIDEIILKKKGEAILQANEAAYTEAIQEKTNAQKTYLENVKVLREAEEKYNQVLADNGDVFGRYMTMLKSAPADADDFYWANRLIIEGQREAKKAYEDAKSAVSDSEEAYVGYINTISNYENLGAELLSGDAGAIESAMTNIQNSLISAEKGTEDTLQRQYDNAKKNLEDIKEAYALGAPGVTEEAVRNAEIMVQKTAEQLGIFADNYKKTTDSTIKSIKDAEPNVLTAADGIGSSYWRGVMSEKNLQGAADAGSKLVENTKAQFLNLYHQFYNEGEHAGEGFAAGLQSKIRAAVQAAKALSGDAVKGGEEGQKSASPSKYWRDRVGKMAGEGYIIGLTEKIRPAMSAAENFVGSVLDAAAEESENNPFDEINFAGDNGLYETQTVSTISESSDSIGKTFSVPRYAAPQYLNLTVELGGQKVQSVIYQMVQDEAGRVGMQIVRGNA